MPTPGTHRFRLEITIRQFAGVIAVLAVAMWTWRAAAAALRDEQSEPENHYLSLSTFFFLRLGGRPLPEDRREMATYADWHARWDHYGIASAIVVILALILLLTRRSRRRWPTWIKASSVVALAIVAFTIGAWIVSRNRSFQRDQARWMASRVRSDQKLIAMRNASGNDLRDLPERLEKGLGLLREHEDMASRGWPRLLWPQQRPTVVRWMNE